MQRGNDIRAALRAHVAWERTSTTDFITGSAVALHCCKAHAKINRKWKIRPSVRSYTLEILSWKVEFAYVTKPARLPAMQILVSIGIVGTSSQIDDKLPLCDFLTVLSCPYLFLNPVLGKLACRWISTFLNRCRHKTEPDSFAAILKILYNVMTPPRIVLLLRNLTGICKVTCQWLHKRHNRNQK